MASESFKVGRGAGETAEPVRCLLFKSMSSWLQSQEPSKAAEHSGTCLVIPELEKWRQPNYRDTDFPSLLKTERCENI